MKKNTPRPFLSPLLTRGMWLLGAALIGFASPSGANTDALEHQVMAISRDLRCLVCQNQSIAESDAPLAVDLRAQVREQLTQGHTPAQIQAYMVARYGEFVRYRPPFNAHTSLLWLGPVLLLIGGLAGLLWTIHRQKAAPPPVLDDAQRQKARAWLGHTPRSGDRP